MRIFALGLGSIGRFRQFQLLSLRVKTHGSFCYPDLAARSLRSADVTHLGETVTSVVASLQPRFSRVRVVYEWSRAPSPGANSTFATRHNRPIADLFAWIEPAEHRRDLSEPVGDTAGLTALNTSSETERPHISSGAGSRGSIGCCRRFHRAGPGAFGWCTSWPGCVCARWNSPQRLPQTHSSLQKSG